MSIRFNHAQVKSFTIDRPLVCFAEEKPSEWQDEGSAVWNELISQRYKLIRNSAANRNFRYALISQTGPNHAGQMPCTAVI